MGGKKVLFIGLNFYNYDKAIVQELISQGYEVDSYPCFFPVNNPMVILLSFFKFEKIVNKQSESFRRKLVDSIGSGYDFVFIIGGVDTTDSFVAELKRKNPTSKFILYLWDSLENKPNILPLFKYFDKIFSFDRNNCNKHSEMKFLPLFYRNEYNRNTVNIGNVDVFHLGTVHSDRLKIVMNIVTMCLKNNISFNFKLRMERIYYYYKILTSSVLKWAKPYIIFEDVSHKANVDYIDNSKAVLDIQHPTQTGLTMRTMELVGMQKKIITTNEDILNYDFFSKENILVIDRYNPEIPEDFLTNPFIPIAENIRKKYCIKSWVENVFRE